MLNTDAVHGRAAGADAFSYCLYASDGSKKYLNWIEWRRAIACMAALTARHRLLSFTTAFTGARISEVLALMPVSFQVDTAIVAIRTLKRRQHHVREVPIPPWLMDELEAQFHIREAQRDPQRAYRKLWPHHRMTGYRIIKHAMVLAEIVGRAACPRGLRHSFGVLTLQAGVPLPPLKEWLGHSRISTTAIYTTACGPEHVALAQRFWQAAALDSASSATLA